jgi:hypothetical protein
MDGIETEKSGQEQIIDEIETYIRRGGGEYRDWYVGMADNPIDPITEVSRFHKVQSQRFTYIETMSHEVAKAVADYFGNLDMSNISRVCNSIYVYKKAAHLVF